MYYTVVAGHSAEKTTVKAEGSEEVPGLKASLEKLQSEAIMRSTKNKELLSKRMLELRSEIKALRNNPYGSKRTGFANTNTASLIDLKG
jgi:hypothetical protein